MPYCFTHTPRYYLWSITLCLPVVFVCFLQLLSILYFVFNNETFLREGQNKSTPSLPSASGNKMIEKEKPIRQRSSTSAAVYKPPAARLADSKKGKDVAKPSDSKLVKFIYLWKNYTYNIYTYYRLLLEISWPQLFTLFVCLHDLVREKAN